MLAVFRLLRGGLETLDITSGERFGYGQRNEFLARQNIGDDALPQFRISEIEHWWQPNDSASLESVAVAARPNARELLGDDKLNHSLGMLLKRKSDLLRGNNRTGKGLVPLSNSAIY